MRSQTISASYLRTICWIGNTIIDWASGGKQYLLDGKIKELGKYHFQFPFDSAISSENGRYAFIYQRLGTKGLLLKDGEILREINRSYYYANAYEFPAAFLTIENTTYLIHCPISYNRLDFEVVETGEIITNTKNRKPDDRFHSRLEISPDSTYLMSKGWLWHPLDVIMVFNIKECIKDPRLLDSPQLYPDVGVEICTASFVDGDRIILGSSSNEVFDDDKIEKLPPRHISTWSLTTNQLSKPTFVKEPFGNLFAINDQMAWDLFSFPKIIDTNTGEIVEQNEKINSGKQQSSIISESDYFPPIIYNRQTRQVAIKAKEQIEVLTPGI